MPYDAATAPSDPMTLTDEESRERRRRLLLSTLTFSLRFILAFVLLSAAALGFAETLFRLLVSLQPALALPATRGFVPVALALVTWLVFGGIGGLLFQRGFTIERLLLVLAAFAWLPVFAAGFEPQRLIIALVGSTLAALVLCFRATAPTLAGLTAFVLYLSTLAPGPVPGDSAEFQSAAARLGIAHPTGYPLYLLLGHLVMSLPLPGFEGGGKLNLLSALCAAGAVFFVAFAVSRLSDGQKAGSQQRWFAGIPAFVGGLILAGTPVFWEQATISEVYALNALIVGAILAVVLTSARFGGQRSASGNLPASRSLARRIWDFLFDVDRAEVLLALLFGLGLAHHRTVALLVPAVAVYLLASKPSGILRLLRPPVVLVGLAPLLLYVYIPWRWPAEFNRQISTEEFRTWVLASNYSPFLHFDAWLHAPDRIGVTFNLFLQQFNPVELTLIAAGLLYLFIRLRPVALFLLIGLLTYAIFGTAYYVPDVVVMLIPAFMLAAIAAGSGILALAQLGRWLFERLARNQPDFPETVYTLWLGVLIACCVALPIFDLAGSWSSRNLRDDTALQDAGTAMLAGRDLGNLPVIIADAPRMQALRYAQGVEGLAPNAYIVQPDVEAAALELIEQSLNAGKQVYLTRLLPGIEKTYRLNSVGPLVHVTREAQPVPDIPHPLQAVFGDSIHLLGWSGDTGELVVPGALHLTLYWLPQTKLDADYWVQLSLIDAAGNIVWNEPGAHPVGGFYPTGAWRPNEAVADYHTLVIPATVPAGEYRLGVSMVAPFAKVGLQVKQEQSIAADTALLSTIHVRLNQAWMLALSDDFTPAWAVWDDGLVLDGYRIEEHGNRTSVALAWRRGTNIPAGEVQIQLGDKVVRYRLPQAASVRFITVHEFSQPRGGRAPLTILRDGLNVWNGADSRKMLSLANTLPALQPSSNAIADFQHAILLQKFSVSPESQEIAHGQAVRVTLTWKVLQPLTGDYTVFMHLLDKDGRVRGQVDAQPVYGTRPTSTWKSGEVLEDTYEVRLAPDAPPGDYRIEIGLYLPTTFQRLYVVNDDDEALSDYVLWNNGQTIQFK